MFFQCCQGKVFVNILPHLKGWRNIECQFGDHTESAQPNNGSLKLFAVFCAGQEGQLTISCYHFHGGDGSRQVSMSVTRTVSCCRTGSCNRNVRQRCQIMQRVSFAVKPARELPIADSCFYRYCLVRAV